MSHPSQTSPQLQVPIAFLLLPHSYTITSSELDDHTKGFRFWLFLCDSYTGLRNPENIPDEQNIGKLQPESKRERKK